MTFCCAFLEIKQINEERRTFPSNALCGIIAVLIEASGVLSPRAYITVLVFAERFVAGYIIVRINVYCVPRS